ncbi:AAA domain-containing protein [Minwuia thermotolerans]|uniref:AAA domain-containing protein n=1 Tax=Minwuia thermotolerans TaxID=2056226 RepID=UPI000D6DC387|nr:AAA domain-containing protein [Minwuia thermotolerans]
MPHSEFSLEEQLARLLSGARDGVSVERLRSLLQAGGASVRKDEIVRTLSGMSARGVAEFGGGRKWTLRRQQPGAEHSTLQYGGADSHDRIHAIPAHVVVGDLAGAPSETLPDGTLRPSLTLLRKLLSYYQACLRASDGGAPIESLGKANQSFVLIQPDAPWWPTEARGRRVRIARAAVPGPFQETLAKASGGKLLLGYPNLLVTPRDPESDPFLRPAAVYPCRFTFNEEGLSFEIPAASPNLNYEWLRDQGRFAKWDPARLRGYLLYEDPDLDLGEEDEAPQAAFLEAPAFAARLESALNKAARAPMDPGAIQRVIPIKPETGLYNVLSLSCEAPGKYVRSAIKDYERLVDLPIETMRPTALAPLFDEAPTEIEPPPAVAAPIELGESQLLAARAGLEGPLTVVTGPPGTGKSQVIAGLIFSAVLEGKSVLFAARQHRALDAVQERLQDLTGERTLMVRANSPELGDSFNFRDALKGLLARGDVNSSEHRFEERLRAVHDLERRRWHIIDAHRAVAATTNEAAGARLALEAAQDLLERTREAARRKGLTAEAEKRSWLPLLFDWLLAKLGRGTRQEIGTRHALVRAEAELRSAQTAVEQAENTLRQRRAEAQAQTDDPVELSREIQRLAVKLAPDMLDRLEALSAEDRQTLTDLQAEAALGGNRSLPAKAQKIVLAHQPVWAVTTLAAGSRIPLEAGLFDYVVFDEAAQTDIASAVPLLYRAKKAVIVGDPNQLSMISNLDAREERALLETHGLYRSGVGRFAQGRTTLFDLAASTPEARRFMLTEHFRCHPDIVGYINEAFYGRRLHAFTDRNSLKVPKGMPPGLHWTDVRGGIVSRARSNTVSGSAASPAEADAVVAEVRTLTESGYEGTIGVVSFFDYQAKEIGSRLSRAIPQAARDRHRIKVFTANKFQGDERDVMLLSLCMAADMPTGALGFIRREKRLLNVAVSRARAVCHIVGDLGFAESCGIPHVETLARRVKRARNRNAGTDTSDSDDRFDSVWERRFYEALRKEGVDAIPQYPVGGRFLDLAVLDETRDPPLMLDLEVDGEAYHRDADGDRLSSDLWRDHTLRGLGWRILRFWVYELRDDMEGCVERVRREIDRR